MAGFSGQLLDTLTAGRVVSATILFFVGSFVLDFLSRPKYPSSIPRLGNTGLGATLRNLVGFWTDYHKWVRDGYEKYTKHGRCFIVPNSASRPPDIVIPRDQTAWMLEQPDHILSTHEAHNQILYSQYNFLGKRLANDMHHAKVIHKNLARNLTTLIPGMQKAAHDAVDMVFGRDTDGWRKVNIWDAWMTIVPRVTDYMLVGPELSQNEIFLRSMEKFTECVVINGFILNAFPKITHPIIGRLVTVPNWWHWRTGAKFSIPLIKERLRAIHEKDAGNPAYEDFVEPPDFVTWAIRLALAENKSEEADPVVISKRLLPIAFAALHTTVLTGHNVFLDIMYSDPSVIAGLREETARIFDEEGGQWTKNGLSKLYRLDSAIRESMRYSHFATTLVERMVVAPEGITNKAEGWHVPYGSMLTLNMMGVQHDARIHVNADVYDAFRYSRPREEYEAKAAGEKTTEETLQFKKMGMVTTSDFHLPFGHGRHACPGRFFVAHEIKMLVAYLLLNYDIRPVSETRPQPSWFGQNIIPPLDACIEVKRRDTPYTCDAML